MLTVVLVARLTGPVVDCPDVHPEVRPLDVSERFDGRSRDVDSQLLPELADECLSWLFVPFDVPTGQIPRVGIPAALRCAVAQQDTPLATQESGNHLVLVIRLVGHPDMIAENAT